MIDNGVGLSAQARGYEGFGIGLKLVEDICARYNWHFSLTENNGLTENSQEDAQQLSIFQGITRITTELVAI
ncbi:MAG: hypothetical protein OIF57_09190 [Marinobacterium sp.]|nr:hypothetical protein [Marinobacterium sp.]